MRFLPSPSDPHGGNRRQLNPSQIISLAFLAAILVGTLLLALPIAQAPGIDLGVIAALFTATSAVCVTGLVLVDTGSAWTTFGQVVILLLIQVGGLGILTFGSLLAFFLGRRFSYQERMRLQTEVNALKVGGVVRLIRGLVIFTFVTELVGALILWIRFGSLYGLGRGAYYAVFHAVSAFNNAGFALYPDSLTRFATDPLVLLTIAALFILGGLGFVVAVNTAWHLADRRKRLTLHSRIVLAMTAGLLLGATLLLLLFEWNNPATLGPMSPPVKLLNAFFQAATPRTAGFNTIDYAVVREVTLVLTIILMFVGANPASTGGGIKTVTAFVVFGSAVAEVRGHDDLPVFGRRIPSSIILKAGTIALFSLTLIAVVLTLLALTDPRKPFLEIVFETFSAFGTVGLSMGTTTELNTLGKLVITALMYIGRLGPVTFAIALGKRRVEHRVTYPPEEVIIG